MIIYGNNGDNRVDICYFCNNIDLIFSIEEINNLTIGKGVFL
jgi:hypothetical protein